MGASASMMVNRVTLCLTSRQKEFLVKGQRSRGIGLSEYIRRILDMVIDAAPPDPPPPAPYSRRQ